VSKESSQNWRFSLFYFFYFCSIGVIVPYWSLHLKSLGFDATEIGELMAILLLTKIVAPNIWAAVGDHITAKNGNPLIILRIATFCSWLVFMSLFWLEGYWGVALAMFGFCAFWNACLPQLEAATLNHLKEKRERYGYIRSWGSFSFILVVLGVGRLVDLYGVGVILYSTALVMFLIFLASFVLPVTQQSGLGNQSESSTAQNTSLLSFLSLPVVTVLTLAFLMQLSHAPFYTFFSIYLEGYGYSKTHIGWLWATGAIFEIGVFLLGFKLLSYFRLKHLLVFTFAIAALRWLIVAKFPENQWIIFFTQVGHAITYGLFHSVMVQIIHRMFQGRFQIRGQALYGSITYGLGGAVGSLMSGYILASRGGEALYWYAGVMMVVVSLFAVFFLQLPKAEKPKKAQTVVY